MEVLLETKDYNDEMRKVGGDPVTCRIIDPKNVVLPITAFNIEDNEDGTYSIRFTPSEEGNYTVQVEIFGRRIKSENFCVEISQHNNPLKSWGKGELCQPVSIARGENGEIFILDIGNARIVVLDQGFLMKRVLENETLQVMRIPIYFYRTAMKYLILFFVLSCVGSKLHRNRLFRQLGKSCGRKLANETSDTHFSS